MGVLHVHVQLPVLHQCLVAVRYALCEKLSCLCGCRVSSPAARLYVPRYVCSHGHMPGGGTTAAIRSSRPRRGAVCSRAKQSYPLLGEYYVIMHCTSAEDLCRMMIYLTAILHIF